MQRPRKSAWDAPGTLHGLPVLPTAPTLARIGAVKPQQHTAAGGINVQHLALHMHRAGVHARHCLADRRQRVADIDIGLAIVVDARKGHQPARTMVMPPVTDGGKMPKGSGDVLPAVMPVVASPVFRPTLPALTGVDGELLAWLALGPL